MDKRVVITGLGVVSPVGNGIESFWDAITNGVSGVGPITHFDTEHHTTKFAAEVKNFDPTDYIEKKETRRIDRFTQYGMAASRLAIEDSGNNFEKSDRTRIGVIIGSGIGGIETFERQAKIFHEKGASRISPFFIPMLISDIVAGRVSMVYDLKGPNYATISACATGLHAIGDACRFILAGDVDVMVAGGTEAAITAMGVAGFNSMKALSTRNDEPEKASRPFDAERDGFVMGDGAGVIVLESLKHAMKRGARIYGELAGIGFTADAYHITAPDPDGAGATRAMVNAMKDGDIHPEEVGYINAHGTSTPYGDKTETKAIKQALGESAKNISISSTKSMTGHLLGAAGGLETVITTLSIYHSIIPPTINYEHADPECDLDYTPNKAVKKEIRAALNNAFGFGGHNACIAIRQYDE